MHPLGITLVAAVEFLLRLRDGRLLHFLHKQVILDPLPPGVLDLGIARRPGHRLAVGHERLVFREFVGHVDEPVDDGQPLIHPLEKSLHDLVGEAHVAPLDEVVELLPLRGEAIDIGLRKIELHRVERLEECIEPAAAHCVVDRLLEEVLPLEMPTHRHGDMTVVGPGLRHRGPGNGRGRRQRRFLGRASVGPDNRRQQGDRQQLESRADRA